LDEEDLERVKSFRDEFKEKYLTKPTVEKKVDKIENGFFQEFMQTFDSNIDIDPGRLISLTDGIFGMVMTLLVFSMALPGAELLTETDLMTFLQANAHTFGLTIVSFILVSSFWVYHHEFLKINSLNMLHLWIHMFFLACISVTPFTTSIMGNYSEFFIAEVLFGINIFLTILTFLIMYHHAYTKGFLEKKPSKSEKRYVINTFIILMGITIAVNLLDYNVSEDFMYLFLLVPVISTIRDIRFRMKSRPH
jgi:uncharacterized membrane protein